MRWYEITGKTDISEIWLYDEIGIWGVGAKEFIVELNAIKSPRIDMHINSPGGEVFDGAAIYNAVKRHPAKVTSYIDGIAASIASVIALAGEKIVMAENAIFMMHNPSGMVLGTSEDMRKTADILDKVCDTMIGAYTSRTGKGETEIRALLDAETWMNAEEAKSAGFVDDIGEGIDLAACSKFIPIMAKLGYKHVPQGINAKREPLTAREIERILRNAGVSSKQAKTLLSKGYTEGQEEEAPSVAVPPRTVEPSPIRAVDLLLKAGH